jgi:hypothetical protein
LNKNLAGEAKARMAATIVTADAEPDILSLLNY